MPVGLEPELVEVGIGKVVALATGGDGVSHFVVLDEVGGDRQMPILIGQAEAMDLVATRSLHRERPFGPQFAAELVRAVGGRVRRVRLDRLVEMPDLGRVYGATVEVDGASGVQEVDARASDALNLAAVVACPVVASAEVLEETLQRLAGDSPDADALRRSLQAGPVRMWRVAG